MSSSSGVRRSAGSVDSARGAWSALLDGRWASSRRTPSRHVLSSGAVKWATPDRVAWVMAPPSSWRVTSSPVTARTTSGPVMNMYAESSTMKTKSVSAGL